VAGAQGRFGAKVQLDGSHHDWFEVRRAPCVLMVMVDATNRTRARFAEQETTRASYDTFAGRVRRHGLMQSVYVDRESRPGRFHPAGFSLTESFRFNTLPPREKASSNQCIMLGTPPGSEDGRKRMAEPSCATVDRFDGARGIVRRHPSVKPKTYAGVASHHPAIRFCDNRDASLDESLADDDVVVGHSSGLGSDALAKRRLAIIMDAGEQPLGHRLDLIHHADCPRVTTLEGLAATARQLLFDSDGRQQHAAAAGRYVEGFCGHLGRNSARRIAAVFLEITHSVAHVRDSATGEHS